MLFPKLIDVGILVRAKIDTRILVRAKIDTRNNARQNILPKLSNKFVVE
jgi:hypothetical protein